MVIEASSRLEGKQPGRRIELRLMAGIVEIVGSGPNPQSYGREKGVYKQ